MNEQKTLGEISCPSIPGAEAPGWGEHNDTGKRKGQPKQNPLRWTDDPRSWRKRLESPQDPQSKEGTDSLRTWILRSLTISQPSKGYARNIAAQINHPWVEFPSWMDHCQEALLVVSGWEKKNVISQLSITAPSVIPAAFPTTYSHCVLCPIYHTFQTHGAHCCPLAKWSCPSFFVPLPKSSSAELCFLTTHNCPSPTLPSR